MYDAGTVILTNSIYPEQNGRFGRFNHAALIFSENYLIESLEHQGVVLNSIKTLINHHETGEFIFLIPKNKDVGNNAAMAAYNLAGTKYRFWSSLFRITQRRVDKGLSCISLVRAAYIKAFGYDPLWRYPDDVLGSPFFTHSEVYSNVK